MRKYIVTMGSRNNIFVVKSPSKRLARVKARKLNNSIEYIKSVKSCS